MYLLLRKSCSLYQDFSLYCTTRNVKIKFSDTPKATPKRLTSPVLGPKTKLSPVASFQKATEEMKSKASGSVLFSLTKSKRKEEKKSVGKESDSQTKKEESKVVAAPATEQKNEAPDCIAEESKTVIRTVWNNSENLSSLPLSPLSNTEGIRHEKKGLQAILEMKKNEDHKGNSSCGSVVLCGCGQPCDMKNENQCSDCLAKLQPGVICGYLYEKADDKNLWRSYFKILGTHLYRMINNGKL